MVTPPPSAAAQAEYFKAEALAALERAEAADTAEVSTFLQQHAIVMALLAVAEQVRDLVAEVSCLRDD